MLIQTHYLQSVFHPVDRPETVKLTLAKAEELIRKYEYDTIAFTGTSGAAMGYILGHLMSLPIIFIRKEKEESHYADYLNKFEGNKNTKRYLIVDDFICTGKTIVKIHDTIKFTAPRSVCVGILTYAQVLRDGHGQPVEEKMFELSSPYEAYQINYQIPLFSSKKPDW